MRYQDLLFFDKQGNNLNFAYDETAQAWYGSIYLPRVSTDLFEVAQIFVVQKMYDSRGIVRYAFPHELEAPSSTGEPGWVAAWNYDLPSEIFFFTYDSESLAPFLEKVDELSVKPDWDPYQYYDTEGNLHTSVVTEGVLQINVALSSPNENIYKRTFSLIDKPSGNLIAEVMIYGEVVGEDPRLSVMTSNLGYAISNSDYQIFRDSDVKEPLYNQILLNEKKKEALLEGSNIFPYTGSYRALLTAIKYFGYDDIYMKEYWRDVDPYSAYFGKYVQTLPIELLKPSARFNDMNVSVPSRNLRKTGKFGLFYRINEVVNNEYDEYDLPVTRESFAYSLEEVLIKLYGLKQKLQKDFLPLNAKIIDIVGEADFFGKSQITIQPSSNRTDTVITGYSVSFETSPGKTIFLQDLRTIDDLDFAKYTPYDIPQNIFVGPRGEPFTVGGFNIGFSSQSIGGVEHLTNKYPNPNGPLGGPTDGKQFTVGDLANVLLAYFSRYAPNLNTVAQLPDNTDIPVGAPLVLINTSFEDTTWDNSNSYWNELDTFGSGSQVFSWNYIEYRNIAEIEWIVSKPKTDESPAFFYSLRGNIKDYDQIALFLPYVGAYDVEMRLYDYYNNISTSRQEDYVIVKARNLEILGTFAIRDPYYTWNTKIEVPQRLRVPGKPAAQSPMIAEYAAYWDLPFHPNDPFEKFEVSWEMFNRANYALNNQYSPFANFHISTFRDNDEYSFVGPFFWDNLEKSRWIDNAHNWWEGTVLAGDTPAFFNIIYYNPTSPYTVLTLVDSDGTHYISIPQLSGGLLELSQWLNGTTDPTFSKYAYNPIRDKDDYNVILYIQCVARYFGAFGDFSSVYGNTAELAIGRTSTSKNYSINWNSARVIDNQITLPRSTHVVFSFDLSAIRGKDPMTANWSISNNTNSEFGDDKYITARYLAYLFDMPGEYSIGLNLKDTNGNKYTAVKNFLIIN
jgi:hypothetical protein